jgi:hypothetical protein
LVFFLMKSYFPNSEIAIYCQFWWCLWICILLLSYKESLEIMKVKWNHHMNIRKIWRRFPDHFIILFLLMCLLWSSKKECNSLASSLGSSLLLHSLSFLKNHSAYNSCTLWYLHMVLQHVLIWFTPLPSLSSPLIPS